MQRFRPSPALLISLVALFVALGGTSYAALKIAAHNLRTGSVGTRAVKNGTLRGRDFSRATLSGREIREDTLAPVPQAAGLTDWAVISAAGTALRGRGLVFATRTGTGTYQVLFNRNVRTCGYLATSADAATQVGTNPLSSNVGGVLVRVRNGGGNNTPTNRSFHLGVVC